MKIEKPQKINSLHKEYSNREITILWKPEDRINSGIRVKTLSNVYKPQEKPWIS